MPLCSVCRRENLKKSDFSTSQLKKKAHERICKRCRTNQGEAREGPPAETALGFEEEQQQVSPNISPSLVGIDGDDDIAISKELEVAEMRIADGGESMATDNDEHFDALVKSSSFAQQALEEMLDDLHDDFTRDIERQESIDEQEMTAVVDDMTLQYEDEELEADGSPAPHLDDDDESDDSVESTADAQHSMAEDLDDDDFVSVEILTAKHPIITLNNPLSTAPYVLLLLESTRAADQSMFTLEEVPTTATLLEANRIEYATLGKTVDSATAKRLMAGHRKRQYPLLFCQVGQYVQYVCDASQVQQLCERNKLSDILFERREALADYVETIETAATEDEQDEACQSPKNVWDSFSESLSSVGRAASPVQHLVPNELDANANMEVLGEEGLAAQSGNVDEGDLGVVEMSTTLQAAAAEPSTALASSYSTKMNRESNDGEEKAVDTSMESFMTANESEQTVASEHERPSEFTTLDEADNDGSAVAMSSNVSQIELGSDMAILETLQVANLNTPTSSTMLMADSRTDVDGSISEVNEAGEEDATHVPSFSETPVSKLVAGDQSFSSFIAKNNNELPVEQIGQGSAITGSLHVIDRDGSASVHEEPGNLMDMSSELREKAESSLTQLATGAKSASHDGSTSLPTVINDFNDSGHVVHNLVNGAPRDTEIERTSIRDMKTTSADSSTCPLEAEQQLGSPVDFKVSLLPIHDTDDSQEVSAISELKQTPTLIDSSVQEQFAVVEQAHKVGFNSASGDKRTINISDASGVELPANEPLIGLMTVEERAAGFSPPQSSMAAIESTGALAIDDAEDERPPQGNKATDLTRVDLPVEGTFLSNRMQNVDGLEESSVMHSMLDGEDGSFVEYDSPTAAPFSSVEDGVAMDKKRENGVRNVTPDSSFLFETETKDSSASSVNVDRSETLSRASVIVGDGTVSTQETENYELIRERVSPTVGSGLPIALTHEPGLKESSDLGLSKPKLNAYLDAASKSTSVPVKSNGKPIELGTSASKLRMMYLNAVSHEDEDTKPNVKTVSLDIDIKAQKEKYNNSLTRKHENTKKVDGLELGGISKSKEAYLARARKDYDPASVLMPEREPVLSRNWKESRKRKDSADVGSVLKEIDVVDPAHPLEETKRSRLSIVLTPDDLKEKARLEAEEKERFEALERERKQVEEQARRNAEEKDRLVHEERLRLAAEARSRREAEEKERLEAIETIRRNIDERARTDAERRAWHETRVREKRKAEEEEFRLTEEAQRQLAEEMSRIAAEQRARFEADDQLRRKAVAKDRDIERLQTEIEAIESKLTERNAEAAHARKKRVRMRKRWIQKSSVPANDEKVVSEVLSENALADSQAEDDKATNDVFGQQESSPLGAKLKEESLFQANDAVVDDMPEQLELRAGFALVHQICDEQSNDLQNDNQRIRSPPRKDKVPENLAPALEEDLFGDDHELHAYETPLCAGDERGTGMLEDEQSKQYEDEGSEAKDDGNARARMNDWDEQEYVRPASSTSNAIPSAQSSVSTELVSNVVRKHQTFTPSDDLSGVSDLAVMMSDELSDDSDLELDDAMTELSEHLAAEHFSEKQSPTEIEPTKFLIDSAALSQSIPRMSHNLERFRVVQPGGMQKGQPVSPVPPYKEDEMKGPLSRAPISAASSISGVDLDQMSPESILRDIEEGINTESIQSVDDFAVKEVYTDANSKRMSCGNRTKLLLCILLALIVLMIGLLVGLGRRNNQFDSTSVASTTVPSTMLPTNSPTMSRLSDIEAFRASLPAYTVTSIAVSGTPQKLAYDWITSEPSFTRYSPQQRLSRFALSTFYYATGGDDWYNNSGWLTELSECDWYTENKSNCIESDVTYLQLGNNNLVGSLPEEIGLLSTLLAFQADGNTNLKGTLPTNIGYLQQLYWLGLNGNGLTGSLPSQLGSLSALLILDLEQNSFRGTIPSELSKLSQLDKLFLNENALSGNLPTAVGELAALRYLDLGQNLLQGSFSNSFIKQTEGFVLFSVEENILIGGLSQDKLWKSLALAETIHLGSNQFAGTIPGLLMSKYLQNVVDLDFYGNELTGTVPSELGLLPKTLENLSLGRNKLVGSVPRELCRLIKKRGVVVTIDCETVKCDCGCACAL
ncbi:hypothetical protein MPSEU_000180400 [Mayamaea pseudoterrestris]|nr:hypothetical protein MPSEU_000180400 [Mayamaea pseudoterrestris]